MAASKRGPDRRRVFVVLVFLSLVATVVFVFTTDSETPIQAGMVSSAPRMDIAKPKSKTEENERLLAEVTAEVESEFSRKGSPIDIPRCLADFNSRPPRNHECTTEGSFTVCADPEVVSVQERVFVATASEEIFEMYAELFAVGTSRTPTIFLYSHSAWRELNKRRFPGFGGFFDGAVHQPWTPESNRPHRGHEKFENFLSTLRHELAHAFLFSLNACIPLSLNEAVAEWLEGGHQSPILPVPWAQPLGPAELESRISDNTPKGFEANARARAEGWMHIALAVERWGEEAFFQSLSRELHSKNWSANEAWHAIGMGTREQFSAYALYASWGYRPHPALVKEVLSSFGMDVENSTLEALGWTVLLREPDLLEGEAALFARLQNRQQSRSLIRRPRYGCGAPLLVDRLTKEANGVLGRTTLCYGQTELLDYPIKVAALLLEMSIQEHQSRNSWVEETPQGVRMAFEAVYEEYETLELVSTSKAHDMGVPRNVVFADENGDEVRVDMNRWGALSD